MYRIRLHERFSDDIEAVQSYIATDNPDAAQDITLRILGRLRELSARPYIGRPGRVPGTRELVIAGTPFIVPYRLPRPNEIEILAVLHGARRWSNDFSK